MINNIDKKIDKINVFLKKHGINADVSVDKDFLGLRITKIVEKNEWKGVEFVEINTDFDIDGLIKGKPYFVDKVVDDIVHFTTENGASAECHKKGLTPSTVEARKAWLVREAKEKFGEINDGDFFDRTPIHENWKSGETYDSCMGFTYLSTSDSLCFGALIIYQNGKWAKKVEEQEWSDVLYVEYIGESCSDLIKNRTYPFLGVRDNMVQFIDEDGLRCWVNESSVRPSTKEKYIESIVEKPIKVDETKTESYVPYQLYPKCNGEGHVFSKDFHENSTAVSIFPITCNVCNGAKIIPMHNKKDND